MTAPQNHMHLRGRNVSWMSDRLDDRHLIRRIRRLSDRDKLVLTPIFPRNLLPKPETRPRPLTRSSQNRGGYPKLRSIINSNYHVPS